MSLDEKKRRLKSFVLRQGRITASQQQAINTLISKHGIDPKDKIDINALFDNDQPLVLEVGFGMGRSLVAMALANPDKNFIGIEVHSPGVGACLAAIEKNALTNLKIIHADAVDVLSDTIHDASLDKFQVFFPDPWHKNKHNKRRLVQKPFVDLVLKKLKAGGLFHMATDWQDYAEQVMTLLTKHDAFTNAVSKLTYADGNALRPKTKFEARGERLGHGVWDLLFVKKDSFSC
jgi:tRNA (guanine-N7-)-methyltransferase